MRKIFNLLAVLLTVCTGIFYACTKTDSITDTYNPGPVVTATVSGRVTDLTKHPVGNATVTIGTAVTTTDVDGRFRLSNVQINKRSGFVKITKSGFFNGSRTIVVNAGNTNYVDVQLIPKTVAGGFNATSGGNVNVTTGGSVNFAANSVVTESSGAAYTGVVAVSAFFLNPADANFNQYMPGDLRGINSSNQERSLASFGMMAVEMNGAGGEKLQLASGKTATITFPIPASMQASAPATIPLWYFDETKGMWAEQGTANKVGTNYVGTVSHFSFWNCDIPIQNVMYEATFKDQNGNPLVFHRVSITSTVYGTRDGYTDSTGHVAGLIPANESLVLKVYDHCGSVLYTQNIGPYSTAANAGVITVTTSAPATVTITGTAVDCSNNPVTNGYVQVQVDGLFYNAAINAGAFSITINRCSSTPVTAQVTAVDITGAQQGLPVSVTVSTGSANLGQLSACGIATTQYIYTTINGVNYNWVPPADSLYGSMGSQGTTNGTSISGYGVNPPNTFRAINFAFNGNTTGSFPLDYLHVISGGTGPQYNMTGTITTTVTEYGTPGQYIAGSFTGNVKDSSTAAIYPITCTYRVKRRN